MTTRRSWILVTLLGLASFGSASAANIRSKNFIVDAPTKELAEEFAQLAEYYRREKALEWLGRPMPDWPQPCPLKVTVTDKGAGGATQFTFGGQNITQTMHIEGAVERLKNSVLPHEVTHTVFAYHFRQPVPRWADEGGSVYSEDELERSRHDKMCREILNAGRGIPLRRLFPMKEYPSDVMVLYAQGYSISRFLVESSDRQTFLNFVAHGMSKGWEDAIRNYYNFRSVDELEAAWLAHLKKNGGRSAVAKNSTPSKNPELDAMSKLTVRQSAWPNRPDLDPAIATRALAPSNDHDRSGENATGWSYPPARLGSPESLPTRTASSNGQENRNTVKATSTKTKPSPPPVVLFPPEPIR